MTDIRETVINTPSEVYCRLDRKVTAEIQLPCPGRLEDYTLQALFVCMTAFQAHQQRVREVWQWADEES